jgi:hypothetical protein
MCCEIAQTYKNTVAGKNGARRLWALPLAGPTWDYNIEWNGKKYYFKRIFGELVVGNNNKIIFPARMDRKL